MKKSIIIRIEENVYKEYKKIVQENGLNMSKRIRNFIDSEIKKFSK
jgi:antitoxin component of RelBE/YafQ-DinJ toxin-antitoxin module